MHDATTRASEHTPLGLARGRGGAQCPPSACDMLGGHYPFASCIPGHACVLLLPPTLWSRTRTQGDECAKGYWTPHDFLVHFPLGGKKYVQPFLKAYPPPAWPGFLSSTWAG